VEQWWKCTDREKMKYWEKNLLSVPLALPQIAHIQYTDLGSNSVSRGEKPVYLFRFLLPATGLTGNAQRCCDLPVYSGLLPLSTVATVVRAVCKCIGNILWVAKFFVCQNQCNSFIKTFATMRFNLTSQWPQSWWWTGTTVCPFATIFALTDHVYQVFILSS